MNDYIVDAFTKTEDKVNLEVDNLNVECITSKNDNFNVDSEGNLTVKSVTAEQGMMSQTTIRDFIYPIGSIYMSVNSISPAILFGGIWEQIQDRFLLACGDIYINGAVGGEETHLLTINEMPAHEHSIRVTWGDYGGNVSGAYGSNYYLSVDQGATTFPVGGNTAHNNMPPYLAVYMWKRIS